MGLCSWPRWGGRRRIPRRSRTRSRATGVLDRSDRVGVSESLAFIFSHLSNAGARRNVKVLLRLLAVLAVLVVAYTVTFHLIMEYEGQRHSWVTGFYWTFVVMSTLGFGDITFESDIGRVFSVIVLLSGTIFILVLLPFTFVQFIYMPWMEARRTARAPRHCPRRHADTSC